MKMRYKRRLCSPSTMWCERLPLDDAPSAKWKHPWWELMSFVNKLHGPAWNFSPVAVFHALTTCTDPRQLVLPVQYIYMYTIHLCVYACFCSEPFVNLIAFLLMRTRQQMFVLQCFNLTPKIGLVSHSGRIWQFKKRKHSLKQLTTVILTRLQKFISNLTTFKIYHMESVLPRPHIIFSRRYFKLLFPMFSIHNFIL